MLCDCSLQEFLLSLWWRVWPAFLSAPEVPPGLGSLSAFNSEPPATHYQWKSHARKGRIHMLTLKERVAFSGAVWQSMLVCLVFLVLVPCWRSVVYLTTTSVIANMVLLCSRQSKKPISPYPSLHFVLQNYKKKNLFSGNILKQNKLGKLKA